ncbi:MAG: histidine phosphatase family protein [Actinomycetota bacterium]
MSERRLYLLRHAKSSWDEPLADHERPLAPRGRKAAPRLGAFLGAAEEPPELILTSPARRAIETIEACRAAAGWTTPLTAVDALYGATAVELIDAVGRAAGEASSVLVVGHEPGLSDAIGRLCGQARVRFPTGAVARLDTDVPRWRDLSTGACELRWLVTPRLLQAARRS